jgi:hypothetical protein
MHKPQHIHPEMPKKALQRQFQCHQQTSVDYSCGLNTANSKGSQTNNPEGMKVAKKKRARAGESTRPRPKDRQLMQDRVKEL